MYMEKLGSEPHRMMRKFQQLLLSCGCRQISKVTS